jgi:transposase-like protein
MNCLKCGCSESTKAGFTRDFQRYKCKNCGYQFTTDKPRGKPPEMKKNAIKLYLEGMGIRAIGRFLGVSNVAVLKWIRKAAEIVETVHTDAMNQKPEIQVVEMDELHHYIQKKTKNYGFGLLLTEFDGELLPFKGVVVVSKQGKSSIIR